MRRTILLLLAVLVAAGGTALVLLYVRSVDERAVAEQERVRVLAATELIEAGESMAEAQAAGKVDLVEVPRVNVIDGAMTSAEGIQDQVALGPIFPGEQIIAAKFGEAGDQEALSIPEGKMAVSVQLSDPARVAGFVTPGSQVAIFVSAEPPPVTDQEAAEQPPQTFTQLLLERVEVLGVGHTTVSSTTRTTADGEQTTEEIPKTILTLAVDQEQAEKLIFSARNGELAFALLTEESEVQPGPGVTAAEVFTEALS